MRGHQEGVLADVQFHTGVQGQHHQLTPGASREKAIRPGPLATVTMCGMPPIVRFIPPPVFSEDSGTDSSFHSST